MFLGNSSENTTLSVPDVFCSGTFQKDYKEIENSARTLQLRHYSKESYIRECLAFEV